MSAANFMLIVSSCERSMSPIFFESTSPIPWVLSISSVFALAVFASFEPFAALPAMIARFTVDMSRAPS